jgi:DNA-binding transcriptional ArsR family regulator
VPGRDDAARLTSVLTLIADPTRARVLHALDVVEEMCVGDLALALDATEDAIGYALRVLRTAGLVSTRKHGRVVYYRLADGFPQPLLEHCLRRLIELSEVSRGDGG